MARIEPAVGARIAEGCPYCGRALDPAESWAREAQEKWGWLGVALYEQTQPVGLLVVSPTSPQVAQLRTVWVHPDYVDTGLGRRMVQSVAAGLLAREVTILQSSGRYHAPRCDAPPVEFLRSVGFTPCRVPGSYRMDLGQTVVDRPSLRELVGRFARSLRPLPPPTAAGEARFHSNRNSGRNRQLTAAR